MMLLRSGSSHLSLVHRRAGGDGNDPLYSSRADSPNPVNAAIFQCHPSPHNGLKRNRGLSSGTLVISYQRLLPPLGACRIKRAPFLTPSSVEGTELKRLHPSPRSHSSRLSDSCRASSSSTPRYLTVLSSLV